MIDTFQIEEKYTKLILKTPRQLFLFLQGFADTEKHIRGQGFHRQMKDLILPNIVICKHLKTKINKTCHGIFNNWALLATISVAVHWHKWGFVWLPRVKLVAVTNDLMHGLSIDFLKVT